MSRISCNVTKDLLPSYLDEICSEESRELVDEHLLECPSCRRFMAQLQEQDQGKDAPEVKALKKVRQFMDIQSLIAILCPLVLMVVGILYKGNYNAEFCYAAMPLFMLVSAFVLGAGRGKRRPEKKEWLFPVFAVLLTIGIIGLRCWASAFLYDLLAHVMQYEYIGNLYYGVGPFMHSVVRVSVLAVFALLAVLAVYAKKKGRVFPVSMNLAYLAMNMALTFDFSLFNMSDLESLQRYWNRSALVLGAEFVIITAILVVLRRFAGVKKAPL